MIDRFASGPIAIGLGCRRDRGSLEAVIANRFDLMIGSEDRAAQRQPSQQQRKRLAAKIRITDVDTDARGDPDRERRRG
jgi:hypothetical protein